ncbi:hypothetical protein, partial [Klebsiella grimontii]|uniref:hypothetical protein n=1 Tax=Klebsiella grimontii TaxID=2058152 RepID=UPI001C49A115
GHLKIGVSVRHIFKPISYLEIQLLSGVSGGYITTDGSRKLYGVNKISLLLPLAENVAFSAR